MHIGQPLAANVVPTDAALHRPISRGDIVVFDLGSGSQATTWLMLEDPDPDRDDPICLRPETREIATRLRTEPEKWGRMPIFLVPVDDEPSYSHVLEGIIDREVEAENGQLTLRVGQAVMLPWWCTTMARRVGRIADQEVLREAARWLLGPWVVTPTQPPLLTYGQSLDHRAMLGRLLNDSHSLIRAMVAQ